jgi:hypothetical protein
MKEKHTEATMTDDDNTQQWDGYEREALYTLVPGDDQGWQGMWSVEDVGREIDHSDDPMAVLRPLINAGLVHEPAKGYVFASRAGIKAVAMIGKVV